MAAGDAETGAMSGVVDVVELDCGTVDFQLSLLSELVVHLARLEAALPVLSDGRSAGAGVYTPGSNGKPFNQKVTHDFYEPIIFSFRRALHVTGKYSVYVCEC